MCVCTDRYRRTASLWQIVNDMEEAIKHTRQDGFLMAKDGRRKKKTHSKLVLRRWLNGWMKTKTKQKPKTI